MPDPKSHRCLVNENAQIVHVDNFDDQLVFYGVFNFVDSCCGLHKPKYLKICFYLWNI